MKKLKYILDNHGNFAIFSCVNTHLSMARGFYRKPISAGFCTIAVGHKQEDGEEKTMTNVHCFGESISLGLKSREEDTDIINENI